ncbi:hypothetical protein ACMFMG_010778 [Clarireedia jacksonii]
MGHQWDHSLFFSPSSCLSLSRCLCLSLSISVRLCPSLSVSVGPSPLPPDTLYTSAGQTGTLRGRGQSMNTSYVPCAATRIPSRLASGSVPLSYQRDHQNYGFMDSWTHGFMDSWIHG